MDDGTPINLTVSIDEDKVIRIKLFIRRTHQILYSDVLQCKRLGLFNRCGQIKRLHMRGESLSQQFRFSKDWAKKSKLD